MILRLTPQCSIYKYRRGTIGISGSGNAGCGIYKHSHQMTFLDQTANISAILTINSCLNI